MVYRITDPAGAPMGSHIVPATSRVAKAAPGDPGASAPLDLLEL